MMNKLFQKLRSWRNDSGQVAVIFALSLVPLVTIIGMTIDFQRTTTVKAELLHELDSASLRGARQIMAGKSPDEVRAVLIQEISDRASRRADMYCNEAEVEFANRNREITINLGCSAETLLGPPSGPENINFKMSATSSWDVGLLDVAFVFDISGSMSSNNRINSLKNAANDALDILIPEGADYVNEGVRIAMVAYDDMVNAGDHFEQVTGLAKRRTYHATDRYRDQRTVDRRCRDRRRCRTEGRTCASRNERGSCTRWTGGTRRCWTERQCYNVKEFYGPTKTRTIRKTIDSTCVWERPGDEAFTDAAPQDFVSGQPRVTQPVRNIYNATEPVYNASELDGNPHGYLAAPYAYMWRDRADHKDGFRTRNPGCSGIKPLGLTQNRADLERYVRNLRTRNGTAGHQGIAWAWYLISENWDSVFTGESAPMSYNEPSGSKAIIMMSDGEFIDQKFGSEQGSSDAQARALCDNIKAQGEVSIYTVAFQAPPAGVAVLEYCASTPQQAFTADDEDELSEAYEAIAGSLSELRIKR
ncbi:MAG: TadE/TadG family type IV pilus assembly protein [Pseudomonadota bacterium]